MNRVIQGIEKVLDMTERYAAAISLLAVVVIMFANVIGRYVFLNAISWADEASRYLMVICVFAAISTNFKTRGHIGVDAFVKLILPEKVRPYMAVFADVISLGFCVMITYYGYKLVVKLTAMHQVSPSLQLPMAIPYSLVLLGMALSSIRCIFNIIRDIQSIKAPPQQDELPGEGTV